MGTNAQSESFADRAFFETLVQQGSDAIITIDTEDQILFANDATERVLGHDPSGLVGESLTTIMPERFHDVHRAAVDAYLETGERTLDWSGVELPARHADGHELQVSITFEEYEYEGERLFSGIIRDISNRKERERQLERQTEQLERFASVVSHDLRSPLQTARSTLAVARTTDDETALAELEDLFDRMDELIDDVLALATQGQAVDAPELVSLEQVATDAWAVAGDDDTTLTVDSLQLEADSGRLRTLFENLFVNARDHGDADEIRVEALADGFAVADDGIGLDHVDEERLFDYGYTESESGTGIGLNIVETVANAHGWRVEVGESDEGGARFSFHEVRLQ
jgi:PAS domain S-box-containing protein